MIAGRLVATGLIALFLAAVCCVGAEAAPWLTDNFDSYTTGNLQGQGGWPNGGSAVQVETTYVKSGKSVEMNYLSWGASESSQYFVTDDSTCYVTFDVAMDTAAGIHGENLGYIKLYNSGGAEITRIYLAHQQLKALLESGPVVLLDNTAMRTWYNVRIGVYPSSNTMDVWVDGVQKVTAGQTYGTPSGVAKVGMGQWSGLGSKFTKSETYVDNISVDPPWLSATKLVSLTTGWEHANIMFPFVMSDPTAGGYRMWYTSSGYSGVSDSNWEQWHIRIALSADGAAWARRTYVYEPVLAAHRYYEGDVLDPATCSGIFDSIYALGPCLIKDGSTYKMWYTGWNGDSEQTGGGITRKIDFKIGYATSPDGLEWTKYSGSAGGGSIIGLGGTGSLDVKGAGQPSVLKEGANYRMWYEGFDGSVWRILYATSSNGISWTKQGAALNPGAGGALDALGARDPVIVTRNGHYEMWYTGLSSASPKYHVMRATSSDGLTWIKVAGEVALHPDDVLNGNESQYLDSVIVNPDNSCRVFFSKDNITPSIMKYGTVMSRTTFIYTEVVNP